MQSTTSIRQWIFPLAALAAALVLAVQIAARVQ